ncbi:Putative GTP cyclohydrolase 1 type 2, NIF3 family [Catalinimonas alkaloidigena]|uniref:Putative GTP cyclohydrolase 1 type 2, NIF3 family n=1 Tax=Catalinimonas alkaloidigena TaxID=1075417 RepID=A0A1G9SXL5_9BACT|nr:Nif3-like dinuclear metal center hexameric protein [Catalinimonas alkaloidigena]SDM40154.1 Putative GTP cyclohydrolase 1 type 2, NIF3 family [Catalinimonas alkaloidigena]
MRCVLFLLFLASFHLAACAQKTLTAREVIARIQQHVGVPWEEPTVDTFKAGDPNTPVTGVAVTMMATLEVLQHAADQGLNLIITHEPTFYDHLDPTEPLRAENDPVLAAKEKFIQDHHLVVWRFHDYWHRRRPDGIMVGMVKALGWEAYQQPDDPHLFVLPKTTVRQLAQTVEERLHVKAMRVLGDPDMPLTRVALAPGAPGFPPQRHLLQRDDVEALVMGEAREWETIEYAADAVTARLHKALIIPGHIPSEQAGMEEATRWLQGFVTEVPVQFVPASEPFWLLK